MTSSSLPWRQRPVPFERGLQVTDAQVHLSADPTDPDVVERRAAARIPSLIALAMTASMTN